MVGLIEPAETAPVRITSAGSVDVLHLPYTYFPDAGGGTEVYVAGLARALRAHGIASAVAAPAESDDAYLHEDVPVYRFATERSLDLDRAYGAPDATAAQSVRALIAHLRPRVVHLHARTAAVSARVVETAREAGAKTVLTYHTPTVSCARGTMMRMGRTPCDGRLDRQRCTKCVLAGHGVPPLVRNVLARTPRAIAEALARAGRSGGVLTALRLGALIDADHRRFARLMQRLDRIVAPCHWVCEVLRRNGVAAEKLSLCRQGLTGHLEAPAPPRPAAEARDPDVVLRLGYFGRLDPTKGVDVVVEAMRRIPNAAVRFEVYGVRQPGCKAYAAKLESAAANDPRVAFRPALPPEGVAAAMARYDLVVVPSRWLETGPLVVLEAFAAGTPVLGARLGGIAELVRDGTDGVLVAPDDPGAWSAALAGLAADPGRIAHLRSGIRPPRTMADVAGDMARLYRELVDAALS